MCAGAVLALRRAVSPPPPDEATDQVALQFPAARAKMALASFMTHASTCRVRNGQDRVQNLREDKTIEEEG